MHLHTSFCYTITPSHHHVVTPPCRHTTVMLHHHSASSSKRNAKHEEVVDDLLMEVDEFMLRHTHMKYELNDSPGLVPTMGDTHIFHLTCPASHIFHKFNPMKTIKTNVIGTLNMLGLAKRILLTSTSEVYGDPLVNPQPEGYWGNVNPIGCCLYLKLFNREEDYVSCNAAN
ncbi:dTDP-glucose 4 [Vigna unguiculata]|uniref:UDP-glucuronate decarboxylase n=1 Tax=Vigna unguiculata TaxID=3917 RepID=A0A4D6KYD3_VIGUN|nr:dTDP-glucose 4 [Vigna unguiculata]